MTNQLKSLIEKLADEKDASVTLSDLHCFDSNFSPSHLDVFVKHFKLKPYSNVAIQRLCIARDAARWRQLFEAAKWAITFFASSADAQYISELNANAQVRATIPDSFAFDVDVYFPSTEGERRVSAKRIPSRFLAGVGAKCRASISITNQMFSKFPPTGSTRPRQLSSPCTRLTR